MMHKARWVGVLVRCWCLLGGLWLVCLLPSSSRAHTIPIADQSRARLRSLLQQLRKGKADARCRAALALGDFRRFHKEIVLALLGALGQKSACVRKEAAHALAHLGRHAAPSLEKLLALIRSDPVQAVRARAAFSLGQIGIASPAVVRTLLWLTGDRSWECRHAAVFSLGLLNVWKAPVLKALSRALHDKHITVKQRAIHALGAACKASAPAVSSLARLLKAPQVDLRYRVLDALRRCGTHTRHAQASLASLVRHERDLPTKALALQVFALTRPDPHKALLLLRPLLLQHKAWSIRAAAASAIATVGPAAAVPYTLPTLIRARQDPNPKVRHAAQRAISHTMIVIPAGPFWMGCEPRTDKQCQRTEKPGHIRSLRAFRIDKFEVTQRAYSLCVKARACKAPTKALTLPQKADHPVTSVSWFQARAFCRWLKKDLPSEAQWEKAARGTDRRRFPWGNQPPSCTLANYAASCHNTTAPVGSRPRGASPYGVLDMIGNAEEWVYDWFRGPYTPFASSSSSLAPLERVVRGGSFDYDLWHSRVTHRFYARPTSSSAGLGFRCAQ